MRGCKEIRASQCRSFLKRAFHHGCHYFLRQPGAQQVRHLSGWQVPEGAAMHLALSLHWSLTANQFLAPKGKCFSITMFSICVLNVVGVFTAEQCWRNSRVAAELLLPPLQGRCQVEPSFPEEWSKL